MFIGGKSYFLDSSTTDMPLFVIAMDLPSTITHSLNAHRPSSVEAGPIEARGLGLPKLRAVRRTSAISSTRSSSSQPNSPLRTTKCRHFFLIREGNWIAFPVQTRRISHSGLVCPEGQPAGCLFSHNQNDCWLDRLYSIEVPSWTAR